LNFDFPPSFAALCACALLAGIVRGFSGFGLSAVFVAAAAFFASPKLLIPAAQAMEIIASVSMLRSVWKDVDFKWLKPLAFGYLFSVPVGVYMLAHLPVAKLRLLGCVVLLVASLCLLFNVRPKLKDGLPLRFGTGIVAGFLAGSTSLGGMVGSVMLFAVNLPPKNLRATLVILFFLSACYSLALGLWHGVANAQTFTLTAWLALPLLIGVAIGSRGFSLVSVEQFKKIVLAVLALLSVGGIVSVVMRV
jgi:uncharacterized protein